MSGDHWTAEEYRIYRETGRMPAKQPVHVMKFTAEDAKKRLKEMEENPPVVHCYDEIIAWPAEKPKRRKYGNEPQYIGWKKFDSKKEAAFYQELMLRVKAGELQCVIRQVPFDLAEKERLQYIADFVAILPGGHIEAVYDVKSEATRKSDKYVIKKKLMKELWDIEITEV